MNTKIINFAEKLLSKIFKNLIIQKKFLYLYLDLIAFIPRKQIFKLLFATILSRTFEFTSIGLAITVLFDSNKFLNIIASNYDYLLVSWKLLAEYLFLSCLNFQQPVVDTNKINHLNFRHNLK